jgi:hypothetical protein
MGGVCQNGDTVGGCGRGGVECTQCGPDFTCGSEQQCVAKAATTCDASNCPGCCYGSTCVTRPTDNACGVSGELCKQCGQNNVCDTNGQCVLNPLSRWRVSAIRAEVTAQDTNGEDWDTTDGSAPDVFVILTCPPASTPNATQTPTVESYYPEWTSEGCMATARDLTKEPIRVTVYDYDPLTPSNDLVADFMMQLTPDYLSNQREFPITPFQALKAMTFRVTLVEN